ncbi:MAG: hypothetical protein AB9907_05625 [Flexilinea sp.]|jgi:DNA-directed RNA polymerase subunit RPC12/RpoP
MKIIGNILAAISLFFGVLFIWGAFGDPFDGSALIIGLIMVVIGIVILAVVNRRKVVKQNVTYQVDLPGDVKMTNQNCKQCGGPINSSDYKIIKGTPTVICPYCGATYSISEEPKW